MLIMNCIELSAGIPIIKLSSIIFQKMTRILWEEQAIALYGTAIKILTLKTTRNGRNIMYRMFPDILRKWRIISFTRHTSSSAGKWSAGVSGQLLQIELRQIQSIENIFRIQEKR